MEPWCLQWPRVHSGSTPRPRCPHIPCSPSTSCSPRPSNTWTCLRSVPQPLSIPHCTLVDHEEFAKCSVIVFVYHFFFSTRVEIHVTQQSTILVKRKFEMIRYRMIFFADTPKGNMQLMKWSGISSLILLSSCNKAQARRSKAAQICAILVSGFHSIVGAVQTRNMHDDRLLASALTVSRTLPSERTGMARVVRGHYTAWPHCTVD